MKLLKNVTMFGLLAGFGVSALADNPISTYHYLADPGAAADDDYFYIITDSDDPDRTILTVTRFTPFMHSAVGICRTGPTTALFTMPVR